MKAEIESRLIALWQQLGLSVEAGSVSYSLLLACSRVLGLVADEYCEIFADLFAGSASERGLAMRSGLMRGVAGADPGEYFASTPKMITKSDFEAAAQEFGCSVENMCATLSCAEAPDAAYIKSISRFIANYLPVYLAVCADGGGLTFDEFDEMGLFWHQIDDAPLPFSVIDSL